jgi:argininosuccinate lyase
VTLWSGRLGDGLDEDVYAFTESRTVDGALWRVDVAGSHAHVRGLAAAGLLTETEAAALDAALDAVAGELAAGTFAFAATDEDVHTAIERRVTELAGATGGKLHTGRSRNDQVALDVRLVAREAIADVSGALLGLVATLAARADDAGEAYLPGYTHLQRAQPVLVAHHLRAHAWALLRDLDRLADAAVRVDVSPLGAGALAGTSLPLDPHVAAQALGFARTFENSLDAVSDRDFVAEVCFCLALVGVHLSRMGEELVLWTTTEFAFASLDDAVATGSSMLPQKKNPDVAELARGAAGPLLGNLTGLLAVLKALPLAYDRDLQEDKAPLLDSIRRSLLAIRALERCYRGLTLDIARMQAAADDELGAAVDLAEWLVLGGVPFRAAHRRVGALVAASQSAGVALRTLVAADPELGPAAAALLEPGVAVSRRTSPGAAGPSAQAAQRAALVAAVGAARARMNALPRLPGASPT